MNLKNKLALGTVQFGVNYGISNNNGQVPLSEVEKILEYAKSNSIDTLDTASLYGNSESVLGKFDLSSFKVVTKTIKLNKNLSKKENLENFEIAFYKSKENLGGNSPYALMFHEANDLLSEHAIELFNLINSIKDSTKTKKIGVSVYTPSQLMQIIDNFEIDIVQLPMNLLDQRFVGILPKLKERSIEIHTRSSFLQGLLLMQDEQVPSYFNDIKQLLSKIPNPRLASCLSFVKSIKEVDKIVVGTTSLNELKEILSMYNTNIENIEFEKFKIENENYILPQNWRA